MAKTNRYWYDPTTGEILYRTEQKMIEFNLPYIERPQFDYANYTVDVETLELIKKAETVSTNPRGS